MDYQTGYSIGRAFGWLIAGLGLLLALFILRRVLGLLFRGLYVLLGGTSRRRRAPAKPSGGGGAAAITPE